MIPWEDLVMAHILLFLVSTSAVVRAPMRREVIRRIPAETAVATHSGVFLQKRLRWIISNLLMTDPGLRWWPGRYIFRWCVCPLFYLDSSASHTRGKEFVEQQTLKEVCSPNHSKALYK